ALLTADHAGQPLASVMVFAQGKRAWYFYGASSNIERNRMPTYLVQFEAMRWAASRGCQAYDLWGIPDVDEQTLESQFTDREDGLWSVYRFKRGFGGDVRRSIGAWDLVFQPLWYKFFKLYQRRRSGE
ncbi:peptidoglycan bridge formation glycyltransferase FemA/FemB family protein, partial [bacterium]|nr:peptidoglycan bridge formation glycyltransferase FemA/FemB family protein [bacterium]